MDIAIAFVTCDKYSHLWDAWYLYFKRYWDYDLPMYFVNEDKPCPYVDFEQIKVNMPGRNVWTERVRRSVEQIPHEYIFFLLDDLFFNKDINNLFMELCSAVQYLKADALRILRKPSAATADPISYEIYGTPIRRLRRNSKYLISYIPNIYRKSVLLDCLGGSENIWVSEVRGSKRIRKKDYAIYDYMCEDWYIDGMRMGKLTDRGKKYIEYAQR